MQTTTVPPSQPNLRFRPPLPAWNHFADPVRFRVLTLECLNTPPPSKEDEKWVDYCTLRIGGTTIEGYSVCAWITGFRPYFFVGVPDRWTASDAQVFHDELCAQSRYLKRNIESVELVERHRSYGFTDGKMFNFIRIEFRGTQSMHKCGKHIAARYPKYDVCERVKIPPVLKALHETPFTPSGWIEFGAEGVYQLVDYETTAQLNIHSTVEHLHALSADEISPLIIASVDIECASATYNFPNPERPFDMVTQIAMTFRRAMDAEVFYMVIFCLDRVDTLEGIETRVYQKEMTMLEDWSRSIRGEFDPDIIITYNGDGFDYPYLMKRYAYLQSLERASGVVVKRKAPGDDFFILGRVISESTMLKKKEKNDRNKGGDNDSSKTDGRRDTYQQLDIPGRLLIDILKEVKNMPKKLRSYSLEAVSQNYLKKGKHPVHYEDMFAAYQDTVDSAKAADAIPRIQSFLTEVRVMRAIEMATRNRDMQTAATFNVEKVEAYLQQKWGEYAGAAIQTFHALFTAYNQARPWRRTDAIAFCRLYIDSRKRGTTLVYQDVMVDLTERIDTFVYKDWHPVHDEGTADAKTEDTDAGLGTVKMDLVEDEEKDDENAYVAEYSDEVQSRPDRSPNKKKSRVTKRARESESPELPVAQQLLNWEHRLGEEGMIMERVVQEHLPLVTVKRMLYYEQKAAKSTDFAERTKYEQRVQHIANAERTWLLAEKTRTAYYCIQDTLLPHELMYKLQIYIRLAEMSRVTRVPMSLLSRSGQTIKVLNLMLMWCRKNGYVMDLKTMAKVPFKGGCVLVPEPAFYKKFVATLDFKSLYPSIIISYRFCWLSLIMEEDLEKYLNRADLDILEVDLGEPSNQKYYWVQNCRTMLPEILEEILGERTAVKGLMALEHDPFKKSVLNGRQLALKICANSAYGATGFLFFAWPCVAIAVCTTLKGRDLIHETKAMVIDKYKGRVIYGDSVTHDTPCLLKNVDTGGIFIDTIVNMIEDANAWQRRADGKEVGTVASNIRIWTETGWTRVKQIIRHRVAKRIYRVLTHTGVVDVTEDHSLLDTGGEKMSAGECAVNKSLLLHAYPEMSRDETEGYRGGYEVVPRSTGEAMAWGLFMADGSCGVYQCASGQKASWAINNTNMKYLLESQTALDAVENGVQFKILDTMKSSNVYKLVPKGKVIEIVRRYRAIFYDHERYKVVPTCILNAPRPIREAFWKGYYRGDGDKDAHGYTRCDAKGKIGAATLYYLMRSLGYNVSINTRKDKPKIYRLTGTRGKQRKNPNVVKRIAEVTDQYKEGYVYDLETENHHFQAGVGQMIVHNTDSVMVIFPIPEHIDGELEQRQYVFNISIEASAYITEQFPGVVELEFEKVYKPYLLMKKKRYAGLMWEKVDKPSYIDMKGIEGVRRDNPILLRDTIIDTLNILMYEEDIGKAAARASQAFEALQKHRVPIEHLVISKEESATKVYATRDQIHLRVADYLRREHPLLAPTPGDRVPYVIVKVTGATKLCEQGANPTLAERENLPIDWDYYKLKSIKKPLDRIFCCIHGIKCKDGIYQEIDYLWEPWLSGHQGITSFFKPQQRPVQQRKSRTKQREKKKPRVEVLDE